MEGGAVRRVYVPELAARMGVTTAWIRQLEKNGAIPAGHTDVGGRRKFWPSDVADRIVTGRIEPKDQGGNKSAA